MNREIKFRAFHLLNKTMFWFDVMNGNHSHGNGYIGMTPFGEEITKKSYRDNVCLVDPTDCNIMQFTGLKDKNGIDIYFDDLYKDEDGDVFKVVKLECGRFALEMVSNNYIDEFIDWNEVEIIGNIYENPELLNK